MEKKELRLREATSLGMTDYRLFQLAASCVAADERQIAKAIMRKAAYHGLPVLKAAKLPAENGYRAVVDGKLVTVGTLGFMRNQDIDMYFVHGLIRGFISQGYLVRLVGVNRALVGVLAFDTIKINREIVKMAHNRSELAHNISNSMWEVKINDSKRTDVR